MFEKVKAFYQYCREVFSPKINNDLSVSEGSSEKKLSLEFTQEEFIKCIKDGNINKINENFQLILDKKWIPNQDKDHNTPLHFAAAFNQPMIIKLLLENGANVNAQTNHGVTPLLYAVHESCPEAVQALFEHAKNIIPDFYLTTNDTNTCMDEAMIQLENVGGNIDETHNSNAMKTFEVLIKMIYKHSNNDQRKMMSFMSCFKGNEYNGIYNKVIRKQLEEEKKETLSDNKEMQAHVKDMRETLDTSNTLLLHNYNAQNHTKETDTRKKRHAEAPLEKEEPNKKVCIKKPIVKKT